MSRELWSELVRESDGRSLIPSIFCKPKPLLLLCSALSSFSSRSFSLFLLSAMRSLKDLIFGVSGPLDEPNRDSRPGVPGRLRLTSRAVSPLSMPNMTRAGLLGSVGACRMRTGERGTSTSVSCLLPGRERSILRILVAMLARDDAPLRSMSRDSFFFFCSAFNFSLASIACSCN